MTFSTQDAFSLLYYLVFAAYGYSSHVVFHARRRTEGHLILTGIYVALTVWSLALAMSNSAPTAQVALTWRKVGVLGWGTVYSLLLHFVLYITNHRGIIIEITESVAGQQSARIADTLTRLTSQGVTIAIDDYGTDYSTLGRLHSFPFHRVKIDKIFVDGIRGRNEKSLVIIRNIIDLVRGLDLRVIAEGVETLEQVKFLRALGCDEIQGYFFHRPLPAQEIAAVLAAPPNNVDFLAEGT